MRENCTYGSMRGQGRYIYPFPLYSTVSSFYFTEMHREDTEAHRVRREICGLDLIYESDQIFK